MLEKKQCRATVSRAGEFHAGRCQKPASLEYEGRWFCKTHYPPNALKRREEWDAKFDAEMERRRRERQHASENTIIAEYVREKLPAIALVAIEDKKNENNG
jgi:hypothetical protein